MRYEPFYRFRFHALTGCAIGSEPYTFGSVNSYAARLSEHPEGYINYLEASRGTIHKQRRKTRKLIRDHGPIRLEFSSQSLLDLQLMLAWKSDQYRRTNTFDILSVPWVQQFLKSLWQQSNPHCRGILSALYAGDSPIAMHFGLLEGDWLHYWFPTYSTAFHEYSPGTLLFLEIVRACESRGIHTIDLGYGEQPYKAKLSNSIQSMPYGFMHPYAASWWWQRTRHVTRQALKRLPAKASLKSVARQCFPNWDQHHYV